MKVALKVAVRLLLKGIRILCRKTLFQMGIPLLHWTFTEREGLLPRSDVFRSYRGIGPHLEVIVE
jgi:hypothetical protein